MNLGYNMRSGGVPCQPTPPHDLTRAYMPRLLTHTPRSMATSRRDFLQRSASAAAVLTLGPLASDAAAETLTTVGREGSGAAAPIPPASIRAFEARLMRA